MTNKWVLKPCKTVTRLPYSFLLNLSLCFETFNDCADVVSTRTSMYPWKKIGNVLYIYWICFMLQIDPSGWKGSVSNGLGTGISLPHCLATGIWNLAPKATAGPKSRGTSFGTTLWRHVQRYCAQFLLFIVIYGNLVLWDIVKIVKNLRSHVLDFFFILIFKSVRNGHF